jgi:signal transduction histidine kinase
LAAGAEALMETGAGDRVAEELAALRRVAVLVADGEPPEEIFGAVAAEVRRLLDADLTGMARYDPDETLTTVARWCVTGDYGTGEPHTPLGGHNVATLVYETARPARMDDYSRACGPVADVVRKAGIRSSVGVPVSVEGRLWGVMVVSSLRERPWPADTEARLAGFTELVGTAIANAQARVDLRGYADEQAALRRVATLIAGGAPPEHVFAKVAAEAGRLLGADVTSVGRFDPGGIVTAVGAWSCDGTVIPSSLVGSRAHLGGVNMATLVSRTGRPMRIDDYSHATGAAADLGRQWGYRAAVGAPITVEGRLWGFMHIGSTGEALVPAGTEERLAAFTELAGTAIANAQARVDLRGYADEQAALRRVATLVAGGAPPVEVFAAVAAEAGRLLGADLTAIGRYDPGEAATMVGAWSGSGAAMSCHLGTRTLLGGANMATLVSQTQRPVRIDDYNDTTGPAADVGRNWGFRTAVGAPITAEGRLWGVMSVGTTGQACLPADTEERLAAFTELAGTAIANAETQAALAASRARIIAAADDARRRIERDLHDGAQQRLTTLALRLRELQATAPPRASDLMQPLNGIAAGLDAALQELREIAHGVHPAALTQGGLAPALKSLARRCPIHVNLHVQVPQRPPDPVEIAAYYVVCEALTNTAKHAGASTAQVEVAADEGVLRVCVRDDGQGGADFGHGSGLVGLKDRAEALDGTIVLRSLPGQGTTLEVRFPLRPRPV